MKNDRINKSTVSTHRKYEKVNSLLIDFEENDRLQETRREKFALRELQGVLNLAYIEYIILENRIGKS